MLDMDYQKSTRMGPLSQTTTTSWTDLRSFPGDESENVQEQDLRSCKSAASAYPSLMRFGERASIPQLVEL